jgi:hypothetical protein
MGGDLEPEDLQSMLSDLDPELLKNDGMLLIVTALIELLRGQREMAACSSDFVLLTDTIPVAQALVSTNKAYFDKVNAHRQDQIALQKKDPKHTFCKHKFGSPHLQQYLVTLKASMTHFEADKSEEGKKKEEALRNEISRISSLTTTKAEMGIRLCQSAEAHPGSGLVKFRIKLDNSIEVNGETFFIQDLVLEALENMGGEHRTLPGPAGAKERKLKDMANKKRIAIARRRK